MATKIVTKNSSTASAVPTASDLVQGELAVNVADKRLFTEDNGGSIVELGTNPSSLTVSGNIDVDGTTNLDVVDIDGAVDMASTLAVGGVVTANAGVVVDNITIDGNEIDVGSGDLTLDVAGNINLDADGANVYFNDGGTERYRFKLDATPEINVTGGTFTLKNNTSDADILFSGNDGGSTITALTLDMSAAGAATFNSSVTATGLTASVSGNQTMLLDSTGGTSQIQFRTASGSLSNFIRSGTGGSSKLQFMTNGEVSRFEIASDGSLSTPTAGTSNVRFGVNAGNSIVSGGNFNTVVGDEAGTAITTGDENTFIGYTAGDATTTATGNTAVGFSSLTTNILGSNSVAIGRAALQVQNPASAVNMYNVAVGHGAGELVTTGIQNTFIGGKAGDATTTGDDNTAVGFNALSANTTASNNTAVGKAALKANTTGTANAALGQTTLTTNTTGSYNSGFGRDSLGLNTTGSNNTAVGESALYANTTADNNTAVGKSALVANTTGSENVAVGQGALDANTTAAGNTAVGSDALTANTTGASNTGIGKNAMEANTTGANNVSVGRSALSANTTGAENVAVGAEALDANTTGAENVSVGYGSLSNATTASYNTAVGKSSLGSTTTGASNTAVGKSAGVSVSTGEDNTLIGDLAGDTITIGSNNTIIGSSSDSGSVSASNRIVLGWTTVGTGDAHFTFGQGAGSDRVYNAFQSNASWTRVSDHRYKEEVLDNTDCGLSFINALRPVTFKFKALSTIDSNLPDYDEDATSRNYDKKMYGLIAQEVKQAMDDNNITDFGGWDVDEVSGIQAISQEMFVHPLIKAVQQLSAQVDALTARIETLEG